jgi:UDP-N-acetylenolpyruvoylglucosamine reductase
MHLQEPGGNPGRPLIDSLGLKGTAIGHAAVSEVHGNFVVNQGGASAAEILQLIESIQQKAKSERGIDLETEIKILGEDEAGILTR